MLTVEKILNYKSIKPFVHLITEEQMLQLHNVIRFYNEKSIHNRKNNIIDFIKCGVTCNWVGRLKIITTKLKNITISEYSCKIRYGDKWNEKQQTHIDKVRMNKENFISRYGDIEGTQKWKERNEKVKSYGLKYMVERYGEVEGTRKWQDTLGRKIQTMAERKKFKPYRNGQTLNEFQNRNGKEIGKQCL